MAKLRRETLPKFTIRTLRFNIYINIILTRKFWGKLFTYLYNIYFIKVHKNHCNKLVQTCDLLSRSGDVISCCWNRNNNKNKKKCSRNAREWRIERVSLYHNKIVETLFAVTQTYKHTHTHTNGSCSRNAPLLKYGLKRNRKQEKKKPIKINN